MRNLNWWIWASGSKLLRLRPLLKFTLKDRGSKWKFKLIAMFRSFDALPTMPSTSDQVKMFKNNVYLPPDLVKNIKDEPKVSKFWTNFNSDSVPKEVEFIPNKDLVTSYLKEERNTKNLNVMENFKERPSKFMSGQAEVSLKIYHDCQISSVIQIAFDKLKTLTYYNIGFNQSTLWRKINQFKNSELLKLSNLLQCENYLKARYDDDIISFVLKFTTLRFQELHHYAGVIQRWFRCYQAKKVYKALCEEFEQLQVKRMKQLKKAITLKNLSQWNAPGLNDDLKNDLGTSSHKKYSEAILFTDPFRPPRCRNVSLKHNWKGSDNPVKHKLTKMQKEILRAAETNDVMYLKSNTSMINIKDLNCKNLRGNTPLYVAVENNNLPVAKCLVNMAANLSSSATYRTGQTLVSDIINAKNENGNTALHKAITLSDFRMIVFLIHMGADQKIKNEWGHTPIRYCEDHIIQELQLKHLINEDDDKSEDSPQNSDFSNQIKMFSDALDRKYDSLKLMLEKAYLQKSKKS